MPTAFDTASAIIGAKSTTVRHLLHIEGYSAAESYRHPTLISDSFDAGGRGWRIWYSPYGTIDEQGPRDVDYISVFLVLVDGIPEPAYAEATFHLLDQAERPVPDYTQTTGFNKYTRTVVSVFVCKHGIHAFVKREFLEASSYLVDDCFKIRCDVTVKTQCYTESRGDHVVPPSDLHRHLGDLLMSREGADVTFQVGAGATFSAHRSILAARSPVLKVMLFGTTSARPETCIRIGDMLPPVFEAFLHFIYTDSLPEVTAGQQQDDGLMARLLLEAADRYDMQRLKTICEEKLCRHIQINTAATMLMFAQQHGCHGLREACVDFLKYPPARNAVMATQGFEHLVKTCPALLKDLISKLSGR